MNCNKWAIVEVNKQLGTLLAVNSSSDFETLKSCSQCLIKTMCSKNFTANTLCDEALKELEETHRLIVIPLIKNVKSV
jgi:hypothetical protein